MGKVVIGAFSEPGLIASALQLSSKRRDKNSSDAPAGSPRPSKGVGFGDRAAAGQIPFSSFFASRQAHLENWGEGADLRYQAQREVD